MFTINNALDKGNKGLIDTYDSASEDGVKQKIQLYLDTNLRSIPFADYGTNLVSKIFSTTDEEIKQELINFLINDIKQIISGSYITLTNYQILVDKDQRLVTINLILSNNQIVSFSTSV